MEEQTNCSLEKAAMSNMESTRNSQEKLYLIPATVTLCFFILFLLYLPFATFTSMYDGGISAFQASFADASQTGILWFNADVTLTIGLYGIIALPLSIATLVFALHTYRKTLPARRSARKKSPIIWASLLLAANLLTITGLWIVTTPPVCTYYAVDGSAPDQCGIPIRPGVHVIDPFH